MLMYEIFFLFVTNVFSLDLPQIVPLTEDARPSRDLFCPFLLPSQPAAWLWPKAIYNLACTLPEKIWAIQYSIYCNRGSRITSNLQDTGHKIDIKKFLILCWLLKFILWQNSQQNKLIQITNLFYFLAIIFCVKFCTNENFQF